MEPVHQVRLLHDHRIPKGSALVLSIVNERQRFGPRILRYPLFAKLIPTGTPHENNRSGVKYGLLSTLNDQPLYLPVGLRKQKLVVATEPHQQLLDQSGLNVSAILTFRFGAACRPVLHAIYDMFQCN